MMEIYRIVIVTLLATTSVLFFLIWRVEFKRSLRLKSIIEKNNIIESASLGGYYYFDNINKTEFFSLNLFTIFNYKSEIQSFEQLANFFGSDKDKLIEIRKKLLSFEQSTFAADFNFNTENDVKIIHCYGNAIENESNEIAGIVIWFYNISEYCNEIKRLKSENSRLIKESKDYINIFNTIPLPIWWRDKKFNIKHCNFSYSKVANDSLEETLRINEIPELDDNLQELSKMAVKKHRTLRMKKHMIVGGERRFFEIIEQEPEQCEGIIGYAVDITKQEEVEQELSRHISAHSDLLESSSSAMAIYGANMKLKFFNNAFVKLWNFEEKWLNTHPTYAEIMEKLREKRMLPEQADFAKFRTEQLKLFQDLMSTRDEFFYLPDGKALRVIVIPHALGGLLFAYEDMTDRFAMERSYNTLIEVQKETLDNLSEGVAVFGRDGTLKLYNPKYEEMWPHEAPMLDKKPKNYDLIEVSKPLFNYGDDWEGYKKEVMERPTTKTPIKKRIERTDGKVIDKTIVSLPDGNYLLSYQDITSTFQAQRNLKERNAALEEVDKLKTEFLASVSYQLRTPLTSIMGFSEMLEEEYLGRLNLKQKDYVKSIINSSSELMTLINDVLDLASMEAGYMTLDVKEFDICSMLNSISKIVSLKCKKEGISLSVKCPKNIGKLLGDEKRLKQVIFNLLSNSIKFTDKGGKIIISAEKGTKGELTFSVADNGIGISKKIKNKVFDRFFTSDNSLKSKNSGTGLGLSVAKSIVELHGGKIKIESKEGEGTKVTFTIKRNNKKLLTHAN
ncbi:MAG: hypothetical protein COV35_03990 [Alphaproteobacteria bacterium CG11_big_fil_rev_8_21_14_0_20_39_49]|nr:MAG: hypothetical protein COV35_03990 [Alphaproteobacteria bacterium CG11_big_fil_rev_8_21_14_0_20_39_49]